MIGFVMNPHTLIGFAVGALLCGAITARYPKLFAWFAKQDASVANKIP